MAFRPKILVVDDEPQMLSYLNEVLSRMGTRPHCLQSSPQAAELINKEKFDGVLLDWRMPELNGLQLAERIRWSKSNSTCPLIMLTANQEPEAMKQCFRAGINFFLQKPASVDRIQHLVNAARDLMLQERVRYYRAPLRVPLAAQWDLQGFPQKSRGKTVNISTTGLLAYLEKSPPPGGLASLEFTLPDDAQPFACSACVIRQAPGSQFGLRFVNLDREDRWRLATFARATLDDDGSGVA